MQFRAFFRAMAPQARAEFASRAGSTVGYLDQVAYGNKRIELGLADVLVALSEGRLTLDDVPLTDRARRQRMVRAGGQAAADGLAVLVPPAAAVQQEMTHAA